MKKLIFTFLALAPVLAFSQRVLENVKISANIQIIRDEEESDASQIGRGEGNRMGFGGGDMDMSTVTTIWGQKSRTETSMEFGDMVMLRDNEKGETYNLMQMMGKKTAMHFVDEDILKMATDSAKLKEMKVDTAPARRSKTYEVINTSERKKIAGYNSIKAYLVSTNFLGVKDSSEVWYTDEIKLASNPLSFASRGGRRGGGGMRMGGDQLEGLEHINGLPLKYEARQRNNTIKYEVTKIDTDPKINPKDFELPAGYEIMEMKDLMQGGRMQGGGGGRRMQVEVHN